jgi:hypothetical protein
LLNIDFFADARAYITNNEGLSSAPVKAPTLPTPTKPQVLNFPKVFISEDCSTLKYAGNSYEIPSFYNKEMIKIRDKRTLEMVFISLELEAPEVWENNQVDNQVDF